jgi:hypothetical protein
MAWHRSKNSAVSNRRRMRSQGTGSWNPDQEDKDIEPEMEYSDETSESETYRWKDDLSNTNPKQPESSESAGSSKGMKERDH